MLFSIFICLNQSIMHLPKNIYRYNNLLEAKALFNNIDGE